VDYRRSALEERIRAACTLLSILRGVLRGVLWGLIYRGNDNPASYYSRDLRIYVVLRNIARRLDGKRIEEGKKELVGAE